MTKWLRRYQDDKTLAQVELVNLLLKSAGCDIEVTEDDINDHENVDGRVADIQGDYQEVRRRKKPICPS